jgi:hypothetical protein
MGLVLYPQKEQEPLTVRASIKNIASQLLSRVSGAISRIISLYILFLKILGAIFGLLLFSPL